MSDEPNVAPSFPSPQPPEAAIGERIKQRRKELGLTVEQLSALSAKFDYEAAYAVGSGISANTLYRYESGATKPGAREFRLLADALNLSPTVLLLGREWDEDANSDRELGRMLRQVVANASEARLGSSTGRDDMHAMKLQQVKQEP